MLWPNPAGLVASLEKDQGPISCEGRYAATSHSMQESTEGFTAGLLSWPTGANPVATWTVDSEITARQYIVFVQAQFSAPCHHRCGEQAVHRWVYTTSLLDTASLFCHLSVLYLVQQTLVVTIQYRGFSDRPPPALDGFLLHSPLLTFSFLIYILWTSTSTFHQVHKFPYIPFSTMLTNFLLGVCVPFTSESLTLKIIMLRCELGLLSSSLEK